MLTADRIRKFAPSARADIVAALVDGADEIAAAGITTPLRLQHFMAQIYPETGGLKRLEENLRYSAKRLTEVWPGRFPTLAAAQPFANNPQALANKVYGGRMGNNRSGDGWRYRGRGPLQTTGKSNYIAAGYENDPDALADPATGLRAALTFWKDNGCNAIADRDDVAALRKRINGGTHGLADARLALAKARRVFTAAPARAQPLIHAPVAPPAAEPADEPIRLPMSSFVWTKAGPSPESSVPALTVAEIRANKQLLRDKGYVMVGEPDDDMGPRTKAAITAFQTVNDLPITATFDEATRKKLANGGKPMKIAPARAEATEAEIAAKVPEVAAARKTGIMGAVQAVFGFFGAAVYVVKDYAASAVEAIRPVKEVIDDVPGTVWVLAIAVMAGTMAWQARNAAKAGAEAYRKGERT